MNKNELLKRIDIDSIVYLLDVLESEKDFEELYSNNIYIYGEKYTAYKKGDTLSIRKDNSPTIYISSIEEHPDRIMDDGKRVVSISYKLDNNDIISLEGNATCGESLFDKGELIANLKPYYYSNNGLNRYALDDAFLPEQLRSVKDGVMYHNVLLSDDGKTILKINGEVIPSKEEIESFDIDKEKAKVQNLYEILDCNGITKKMFENEFGSIDKEKIDGFVSKLEKRNKNLDKLTKEYEEVTDKVSGLLEVRDKYVSGAKTVNYPEEALLHISKWIYMTADQKRIDRGDVSEEMGYVKELI